MARHEISIGTGFRAQRSYEYDDFYINKKRFSDVLKVADPITPFGWLGTDLVPRSDIEDVFAKMLLGMVPSDLRPNRIPIYVCGECADYGCGVTTCKVTLSESLVEWSEFGYDNNYEEETYFEDRYLGLVYSFDRTRYEEVFRRYIKT